ncbi:ShlB/FhaC/HecB family hemolysin secretion/activation protein [Coleofasciculus sp. FACHB-SPT36]|uniref:ShlB/FhaC/HecB family hemolysin secretion/activation protein n=1 Tax=Cyanophyceae TaxID=3028117 RepID=UPI00168AFCE0|nr:ShlB/FhaC/HecB family hemolysin secretion/activation protein [Coleofasciculus sp. FACHB-SPT36]MBD2540200.1 ShlB/FhaC/HecB family hemolysin secretion/activation protein [Coleofasciculus sp. FACHB-SPT36]
MCRNFSGGDRLLYLRLGLAMLSLCLTAQVARSLPETIDSAQVPQLPPPQDILQPPSPSPSPLPLPETPAPLPPPGDLLQSPTQPSPDEETPGETVPGNITVEKFEFIGNTAFSSEKLAEITKPFTNRPISFAELLQARTAVTEFYVNQGYITSGALIPANQTIQGGVVTIQVVEGGLEDIKISGTRRLNSNYVRSRLAVATSKPLNRERLLEALQLLQLNPLIANLSAELSAGTRPGFSLLEVRITEAKTFSTQIGIDNGRSPSVGSFRRRLQVNEANLFGLGDGLSLAYSNTDGSDSFDTSYTLPINPYNGTFSVSYGTTSSDVIEPPFDRLDIYAASRYYELTLRQPIVQTPTQQFTVGLTASRRESETSLLEIPFPLSAGADDEGRTRISALRLFQEWTQTGTRQVIALRSQFNIGLGAFDATLNESGPDSRFYSWQGQAQWVRLLAPETLLLVRGNVQLADRTLVPLEQFGLGGLESIRGYRQDALLTDNGVLLSAELQYPVLRVPQVQGVLQIIPFVDFGTAWNSSGREDPDPNRLLSVGLGLQWRQSPRFSARLDWGIPLVNLSSRERTWQENGLYFSVQYNLF